MSDTKPPISESVAGAGVSPFRGWATGLFGYAGLLAAGVGVFLLVRGIGEHVFTSDAVIPGPVKGAHGGGVPVILHLIAVLSVVITFGYVFGRVFRRLGQPPVIGEVIAGIVLGPSVLGYFAPDALALLIPSKAVDPHGQVTAALMAVSQLGVILYIFLVGLELNAGRLASKAHVAVAVSHTSIVVPFVLGTLLSLGLYREFASQGVPFTSFSLFMGIAMSITAFPVLARILTDRGLDKTELGSLALTCAAADDVTAWCLLAFVVGVAQNEMTQALFVIFGAVVFLAGMFLVVQPLARRWIQRFDETEAPLPAGAVSAVFLAILVASWTTEAIGIHAVFGAFLLGAIIPHESRIAREFTAKLRDPVLVLLLPAFFAYTGLRTQIALLNGATIWVWAIGVIIVATLGKFGGTYVAARLNGLRHRDAAALGMLMNTRGLMELIVLNIGLDLGIISPTLFAMMVLMALVTTAMTAPVVDRLVRAEP